MTKKNNNNDELFQEAELFVENIVDLCDLIDDELDEKEKITPEELEKARKRYYKDLFLGKLDQINCTLRKFLDKNYELDNAEANIEVRHFFSTMGKDIFFDMDRETFDNYTRLIRNEAFIKQIKDKKFQKYVSARKSLYAFKKKVEKSNLSSKDYVITDIMAIANKLDQYISSYLMVLLIMSNTDSIIETINKKLKGKK